MSNTHVDMETDRHTHTTHHIHASSYPAVCLNVKESHSTPLSCSSEEQLRPIIRELGLEYVVIEGEDSGHCAGAELKTFLEVCFLPQLKEVTQTEDERAQPSHTQMEKVCVLVKRKVGN